MVHVASYKTILQLCGGIMMTVKLVFMHMRKNDHVGIWCTPKNMKEVLQGAI